MTIFLIVFLLYVTIDSLRQTRELRKHFEAYKKWAKQLEEENYQLSRQNTALSQRVTKEIDSADWWKK